MYISAILLLACAYIILYTHEIEKTRLDILPPPLVNFPVYALLEFCFFFFHEFYINFAFIKSIL